jgi:hypothetical protein
MNSHSWSVSRNERFTKICGSLVIISGGAALIGWFFDISTLK